MKKQLLNILIVLLLAVIGILNGNKLVDAIKYRDHRLDWTDRTMEKNGVYNSLIEYFKGTWAVKDASGEEVYYAFSGDSVYLCYVVFTYRDHGETVKLEVGNYDRSVLPEKNRAYLYLQDEKYRILETDDERFIISDLDGSNQRVFTKVMCDASKINGTYSYEDKKFIFNEDLLSESESEKGTSGGFSYELTYLGENYLFVEGQCISEYPFYEYEVIDGELLLLPLIISDEKMAEQTADKSGKTIYKSDVYIHLKKAD